MLLSCELFVISLDMLNPNAAVRCTAISNLLNEIETKRYSLPYLMGNPDMGATVTDFMSTLQSIDYNKFESFSNVADEISAKLLWSFLECELLVVVSDWYDFKFSIKAAKRKRRTEDSTHTQEIETIGNQKLPNSFQSYLENSNNKTKLVNTFSKNKEKHYQTFWLPSKPLF